MPNRKSVSDLQFLCFSHICKNLSYYVRIYRNACVEVKEKYTDLTLYTFHLLHSENLIHALRDRLLVTDSDCPSSIFIDMNHEDGTELTDENLLSFLLNPHLKKLDIGHKKSHRKMLTSIGQVTTNSYAVDPNSCCRLEMRPFKISPALLTSISNIRENLSSVNVRGCILTTEDFESLLKEIPKVQSLDISYTCCSDLQMPTISKHCPLLKILILAGTEITDKGIDYLCNSKESRLTILDIDETDITVQGTKKALESFKSLEALAYTHPYLTELINPELNADPLESFRLDIPITRGIVGVPWTLHEMHNKTGKILDAREYVLKQLVIGKGEMKSEILETVIACCPTLVSLMIWPNLTAEVVVQCSKFLNLKELHISLGEYIPRNELREFLLHRGHQLEILDLVEKSEGDHHLYYEDIVNGLKLCTNLRIISFSGFVQHEGSFSECAISSLPCLEGIIINELQGSAATEFLTFLLCASTRLCSLRLLLVENSIDAPLQNARRSHNFLHLHELTIYKCAVTPMILLEFFEMENLKYLVYPFARNAMIEVLNNMCTRAKRENMNIIVLDYDRTTQAIF